MESCYDLSSHMRSLYWGGDDEGVRAIKMSLEYY